jgi:hypothetical protein
MNRIAQVPYFRRTNEIISNHLGILSSILQVDLSREIVFRNSKLTFSGVPIIASNMDTVGTFQMAQTLAKVTKTELQIPNDYIRIQIRH